MPTWPITFDDVIAARARLAPHLSPTPLRHYPALDEAVGHGIKVWVKHENHQPTNAFKVRNGLAALTALPDEQRARGVIAATRGNYGQGLAWAGRLLGIPVTVCVPVGNSPDKNRAMIDLGAELVESGRDYDASVVVAENLASERGLTIIHSTNHCEVIAGAGTIALEMAENGPELDALVMAVGGGSQAVGALTVMRHLRPEVSVYGAQAANAPAIYDSWVAGKELSTDSADTFADGIATRHCYAFTFAALREGLADFVTATEAEIAAAIRLYLSCTHNLAEGAGAVSLAGLCALGERLAGKTVGIILSGANIDGEMLTRVLDGSL
ncbi:MAG TPA: threonine/serine dehydratase [Kofleriaceae bacterium]|nr:threonine/serine dehydratase [Kofleriaceae bacterium]